mgnify:CR=1 FL=1
MENNDQKIRELKERLTRKDTSVLLQTLKEVKMEGNYSLIPYLISVLKGTNNKEIQNRIIDILNNLNIQYSVPYLVESIKNTEQNDLLNILISSCWKNGLDFSDHLEVFVDKFIQYDFDVALEAFTVIENATKHTEVTECKRMIDYLNQNLEKVRNEKKVLLEELIQIFKSRTEI